MPDRGGKTGAGLSERRSDRWEREQRSRSGRVHRSLAACLALVLGSWLPGPAAAPRERPPEAEGRDLEARAEALLRRMTLEEKVGQLVQYSDGQPTGPGTGRTDYGEMIARGQIGALLNVTDPAKINTYQRIAVEQARLGIPLLFGLDILHGFRTEFPIPLGLASTWDPALVERSARVAAGEAAAHGIRWTFSPMVDIARDARWGRMAEGAGEDPYLGAAMAAAYVRGYQGSRLDDPASIAACAKHFVGYGAAEGGRDYNSTDMSERTLREVYLPPFQAAAKAGAATFMAAFNALNGVPSTANPYTLKQILRKEWGYTGVVVSDWQSIGELLPHGVALDGATAARKAFLAGVDLDMASNLYHEHLARLVKSGAIGAAALDAAVRRVLQLKLALGLFERPLVDAAAAPKALFKPESLALAQEAAEKSLVLLKNSDRSAGKPLLPLSGSLRNLALIGPLGDDPNFPEDPAPAELGTRSSLRETLARRVGTEHLFRYRGGGVGTATDRDLAEAVAGARKADLVVLALGESPAMSGEAASRTHLGLPGRQQELLEAVVKTGKPVVLVLFSGRPLTLPWAFDHVPAVLAAWLPGVGGPEALARVLFGEAETGGRLVVSWPRSVGQLPLHYDRLNTGRPPGDQDPSGRPRTGEVKWVSRYLDEQNGPQFPFGYGVSYTRYDYGRPRLSTRRLQAAALNRALAGPGAAVLVAEVPVSNTGRRPGETVAQLYLQLRGTGAARPIRTLKGFQRVALAPGETRTVRFELGADAFAVWTEGRGFAVEPARADLWISSDSASGQAVTAEILP